jgi:hypothetical protein
LTGDAAHGGLGVSLGEVVRAQVVVVRVSGEHVPDSGQDGVLEGHDGFLFAQSRGQPSVTGCQVGVFAAGGHGCGAQRPAEPPVAVSGVAGFVFPADSCCPGHTPVQEARCPAVAKRVMSPPVSAMITSAVRWPTPGDGLQPLNLAGKRAHLLLDPRREFPDHRGELIDALQMDPA